MIVGIGQLAHHAGAAIAQTHAFVGRPILQADAQAVRDEGIVARILGRDVQDMRPAELSGGEHGVHADIVDMRKRGCRPGAEIPMQPDQPVVDAGDESVRLTVPDMC